MGGLVIWQRPPPMTPEMVAARLPVVPGCVFPGHHWLCQKYQLLLLGKAALARQHLEPSLPGVRTPAAVAPVALLQVVLSKVLLHGPAEAKTPATEQAALS